LKITKLLLDRGLNPDLCSAPRRPLHLAVYQCLPDIIELLIEHGRMQINSIRWVSDRSICWMLTSLDRSVIEIPGESAMRWSRLVQRNTFTRRFASAMSSA